MDKKEIDELKRKFELKQSAKKLDLVTGLDSEESITTIVDALYESSQKGENVYAEKYASIPTGLLKYKIYSCDLEGMSKEDFLAKTQMVDRTIGSAKDVVVRNGSFRLAKEMFQDFDKGSETIYAYNGRNGISAIFSRDDLDVRTDDDFLEYATLTMEGETREEIRAEQEAELKKIEEEREARAEANKKKIPEWIEQGNALIFQEKQEEWKEYVESFKGKSIDYAEIVGEALEVMESLEKDGSMIKAEEVLASQGHSGSSMAEVVNTVFRFSKLGPSFYRDVLRYVYKKEIDSKTEEMIMDQQAENNGYALAAKTRSNGYEISTDEIGLKTLDTQTTDKVAVAKVENSEMDKDNTKGKKGEEK